MTYQHGGYAYGDHRIRGFSLRHLSGGGCAAYGNVPFLPTQDTEPPPYATFSHVDGERLPVAAGVDDAVAPGTGHAGHGRAVADPGAEGVGGGWRYRSAQSPPVG
ncbi:hypothetical protein [Streptomyces sp. 4F14]|uniref:hypothetical protein n=1 Tax=Streptomyces sp. 4F14 TaxID=3394380 RepID=UPI003A8789F7